MKTTEFKYDIAISLCKEDVQFARDLKVQLNPGLRVFFYEQNQEEIIGRSGIEVFAEVFHEARVVIILSRKEWSETFYTKIEMNAISERLQNEGFDFIVVIPMVPGEKPVWYPNTRIYADPFNLPIETIAKVVEYRVTQSGGIVKPLTLEDLHQNLLSRIEEKKKVIQLQITQEALDCIVREFNIVKDYAVQKREFIKESALWDVDESIVGDPFEFRFMIDGFLLEFKMLRPNERYQSIVSTQDYTLAVNLYSVIGRFNFDRDSDNKNLIESKEYKFLYDQILKGWAIPYVYDNKVSNQEESILFKYKDSEQMVVTYSYYNLKNPISSGELVDYWFKELIKLAAARIFQYV